MGISLTLGACTSSGEASEPQQDPTAQAAESNTGQVHTDAGSTTDRGGDSGTAGDGGFAARSDGLCSLLAEGSTADPSDPQGAVEVFERIEAVVPDVVASEIVLIRRAYEALVENPQADYADVFGPEVVGAGMMLVAWESEQCSHLMVEVAGDHIDSAREVAEGSSWDEAIVGVSIVNGRAAISMWRDATDADAMADGEAIVAQAPGGGVAVHVGDRRVATHDGGGCA